MEVVLFFRFLSNRSDLKQSTVFYKCNFKSYFSHYRGENKNSCVITYLLLEQTRDLWVEATRIISADKLK